MSDILRQVERAARALNDDPHIDIDALCYFVEQHEFDEIVAELSKFSNVLPGNPLPVDRLKIRHLEVRVRRRAP